MPLRRDELVSTCKRSASQPEATPCRIRAILAMPGRELCQRSTGNRTNKQFSI
jgi:hypothetical protein